MATTATRRMASVGGRLLSAAHCGRLPELV
jgi:hypothetical protein